MKREHGSDWHQRLGAHGGKDSALASQRLKEARWRKLWPGVPVEIARAIHTQGYNSGHATGLRSGRRLGWAEALGEKEDAA
jgi:hypothetical protein